MKIEIWSDLICPWCYIGKRRLEGALLEFKHSKHIEIEWKSYQLDPSIQTDPTLSIHQYLAERKGLGIEQAKEMGNQVSRVAESVGLEYHFDKTIPVNTIKAHRFLHFAKTLGKQNEAKERLLMAYFKEGKNLDDNAILIELANEIEIDGIKTEEVLTSNQFNVDVQNDINEAVQLGLRGVPFFVFDRKYGISGAQEKHVFLQTLDKSFTEWLGENPLNDLQIIDGQVCSIDGLC